MTDTLPRTIPTDPAEQERLMPEWVKVEACRLWNGLDFQITWKPDDVTQALAIFAHALTIWQWVPEPVDPDLLIAREVCAEFDPALDYHGGSFDDTCEVSVALAAIKRVRAMEREEG